MRKMIRMAIAAAVVLSVSACAPEVGSDKWCAGMKEKPKSDWTGGEAGDYTKYCVLGVAEPGSDEWCEKMKDKSDSDMSVEDAKTYARHCVI